MKNIEDLIKKIERIPKPKNETKKESSKSGGGTFKPIKIGDQEFTMEEFEEYQKE